MTAVDTTQNIATLDLPSCWLRDRPAGLQVFVARVMEARHRVLMRETSVLTRIVNDMSLRSRSFCGPFGSLRRSARFRKLNLECESPYVFQGLQLQILNLTPETEKEQARFLNARSKRNVQKVCAAALGRSVACQHWKRTTKFAHSIAPLVLLSHLHVAHRASTLN